MPSTIKERIERVKAQTAEILKLGKLNAELIPVRQKHVLLRRKTEIRDSIFDGQALLIRVKGGPAEHPLDGIESSLQAAVDKLVVAFSKLANSLVDDAPKADLEELEALTIDMQDPQSFIADAKRKLQEFLSSQEKSAVVAPNLLVVGLGHDFLATIYDAIPEQVAFVLLRDLSQAQQYVKLQLTANADFR